jgi:hypothetical protein
VHAHLLVADLPEQVRTRPRRARERQRQLIRRQPLLVRAPQRLFRAEIAVRRHQPPDPLVRPEEVVVRDVVGDPLARVTHVLELHPLDQLALDRLPQPLALAHRFRVVGARHHVPDAELPEQLLEFRLAAPREELPPLVAQDLARLAKAAHTDEQRLLRDVPARCAAVRIVAVGRCRCAGVDDCQDGPARQPRF